MRHCPTKVAQHPSSWSLTVHNVREGFATNSSSTHSIVYMRGAKLRPVPASSGFGWDDFTLIDKTDKRRYLAAQVYQSLCRSSGHDVALTIAQAWTGVNLTPDSSGGIEEYVDHQSVMSFPSNFDGRGICREYVNDMLQFLDRDDVAILGGNDNSDGHPDLNRGDVESAGVREGLADVSGTFVARKDPSGYWVLFNRANGNRLRVSFGNGGFMEPPVKAAAPELLDVKITDWCNAGCDYCAPADTQIQTPTGTVSIEAIKAGDTVLAYDESTKEMVPSVVAETYVREVDSYLIDIKMENGCVLSLTAEHPVLTSNRGWVLAGDLHESDELIESEALFGLSR